MPPTWSRDVVRRHERNPILTVEDIPFPCNTVFNAACTMLGHETLLLLRVEDLRGHSLFALARSSDGVNFIVEDEPVMEPGHYGEYAIYERKGIEDPRITRLEDTFYVVYTAASDFGPRLALARTDDFHHFERVGLISEPENKDGALFPRKINDRYVRLDRPMVGATGHVWISFSDDLIHWGDSRVLLPVRGDSWDSGRVGASAPPIETRFGWLEIYHGVKFTAGGPIYRLGAAMLDINDPTALLCRSVVPILTPREYYERVGDVNNVVFSCGAILDQGDELRIYYGAADTSICLGTARIQELMDFCAIG